VNATRDWFSQLRGPLAHTPFGCGPFADGDLQRRINEARAGMVYVNVHSTRYRDSKSEHSSITRSSLSRSDRARLSRRELLAALGMITAYSGGLVDLSVERFSEILLAFPLVESSLSFLGLGPAEPTPAWGLMLRRSATQFAERAPWLAVAPGLAISLAMFAFNFVGHALRDALDPRLRI
jgi:hypothetical protein